MKYKFNSYCMSSYLAFRYVAKPNLSWILEKNIISNPPTFISDKKEDVENYKDLINKIKKITDQYKFKKIAILLSSGIDSAILAALLPSHVKAYTVRFNAHNSIDESIRAREIANYLKISHQIVDVGWHDYQSSTEMLMRFKNAPLHQVEPAIYQGALAAKRDGIDIIFTGGGADTIFGGMDKLLSKDWLFEDFIKRYNYIEPNKILKNPADISDIYEKYRLGEFIDVVNFLRHVFGSSTIQMFENAISAAGCEIVAPFSKLKPKNGLDLTRIRSGEPKYILKNAYRQLFPNLEPLHKIPFARPMDEWLSSWSDLHRDEFKNDIKINTLTGDQKWLIYCLQRFLDLVEEDKI